VFSVFLDLGQNSQGFFGFGDFDDLIKIDAQIVKNLYGFSRHQSGRHFNDPEGHGHSGIRLVVIIFENPDFKLQHKRFPLKTPAGFREFREFIRLTYRFVKIKGFHQGCQ
jgi:hypothetical protein